MLIAIEGVDGVGKTTICGMLHTSLPNCELSYGGCLYDEMPPSFRACFNRSKTGTYDSLGDHDMTARLPFVVARAANKAKLSLATGLGGANMVCDRYVGTNAAYAYELHMRPQDNCTDSFGLLQATWVLELEFEILNTPKPDITCVLLGPIPVIQERLVACRAEQYAKSPGENESSFQRLAMLDTFYRYHLPELMKKYDKPVVPINAFSGNQPRPQQSIVDDILQAIQELQ